MPKLRHFMVLFVLALLPSLIYAQDGAPHIIASHNILGDVVSNVVGDVVEVKLVMPVGADPHSFQATPTDLTALATADVVFVNGALYEEGLLEAIENAATDMNIVEVSQCVEIIPVGATGHDHEDEHEHADEHDHDDEDDLCAQHIAEFDSYHEGLHDHGDEEHEHSEIEPLGRLYAIDCGTGHDDEHEGEGLAHAEGGCDPHVWMEPHNVMYWTMMIRDTLIELDPTNADIYRANADAYLDQLDSLIHDELIPLVDTLPQDKRVLITSHHSLGYLADAYDFELIGTIIPGGSTVAEPSIQDIANLIDLVNDKGVPAIFGETTINGSIAQTITDETDAQLVFLYSGSLSEADGGAGTYLDYIRYNYTAIVTALGGGQ